MARLLAACYARSGDLDLARAYIVVARENHTEIDPDRLRLLVPNRREEDTRHLLDALRMAAGD